VRLDLRVKILLLTALPLAALTAASLWLVDHDVSARTGTALRGDLVRAADLLENMLAERTSRLEATGAVIVRDPKFFSILSLPHGAGDDQYAATVAGVASDFESLAHPDVFEVVDGHGDVVASVGRIALDSPARTLLGRDGLAGRTARRAVAVRGTHVLLVSTPVVADRRVIGALLLGTEVGGALAADLRQLTQSDVTFLSGGRITRSTLERADDRAVAGSVAGRPGPPRTASAGGAHWIALARPLPYADEARRESFVVQRSLDVETAVLREVRGHLITLGALTLLALMIAAGVIATGLAHPIRQLVAAAEAMERGSWDAPIERGRRDELGVLADQFDHMRRRQRVYVESLEEVARAKSEFIAVASHELRTPIAIIMGWRDLFGSGVLLPPDPRFDQGLEAIGHACKTLERIAVDATRMAEIEQVGVTLDASEWDIAPLLESVTKDVLAAAAGRDVAIAWDVEPAAASAWVDAEILAKALDALARNGVRFTPDGGSVRLEARARDGALLVHVRDTGIGLSREARARLAERTIAPRDAGHHQTGRGLEFNHQGLGFGLALARRVAEAHGGSLEIDGEEGHGSTFTLVLPEALAPGRRREAA
jgi:signal transduction histidine kinase